MARISPVMVSAVFMLGFAVDHHNQSGRNGRDDDEEGDCEGGHVRLRVFRSCGAPYVAAWG